MNLTTIQNIFTERHDFDDEDVSILKLNWPNINFVNIPTSWIVAIDNMLVELNSKSIFEIRQGFGQLMVKHGELTEGDKKIIKQAEEEIYYMDRDLHILLKHRAGANDGKFN